MAATALMDDLEVANEVEWIGWTTNSMKSSTVRRIEKPPMSVLFGQSLRPSWFESSDVSPMTTSPGKVVGEMLFRLPLKR